VFRDAEGGVLVADYGNNRVRRISPTGIVSTLAGTGRSARADGVGAAVAFINPMGIASSTTGAIAVTDYTDNTLRLLMCTPCPAGSYCAAARQATLGCGQWSRPMPMAMA
jgi:hypothetical protein